MSLQQGKKKGYSGTRRASQGVTVKKSEMRGVFFFPAPLQKELHLTLLIT